MNRLPSGGVWILSGIVGLILSVAGSIQTASAVSVTTSTYAKDTGPSSPNPNPNSKGPTTATNATSISASMKSDTTRAHATANATSKVVGATITKTASGSAYADANVTAPYYDTKSFSWSAVASGTLLIARTTNTNGAPANVPFAVTFPAYDDPTVDYGFPQDGSFQAAFGNAAPPAQGIVRRNAGIDPTTLATMPAAMTNPVLQVKVILTQSGNTQTLFDGTATFLNDVNQNVTLGGSFGSTGVTVAHLPDTSGAIRTALSNLPRIDFTVKPDDPFDLLVDVSFALGDPTATSQPSFDFPDVMAGNFGVAGAFSVGPVMTDTEHFQLQVLVPEPATVVLGALGVLGLFGLRSRRNCRS
jgi:hypothetical protein